MSNIDLHIEELDLHGFSPHDRYHMGAAGERELTRLLREQGVPRSLSRNNVFAQLNGGTINLAAHSGGDAVGSQVVQARYGGFHP